MKDAKAKGDLAKMGRISKNDLSLSVSFGSKSEESQSNSTSKLAQGSHVDADGNVAIQATQGNIDVKGSDITGKNIALDAKKNVNITAGENSNKTTSESHNSDAGFGVSFSTAGLTGVELHSNKQNDAVKENTTTYKASTVTAKDTLDLHSGEDTNILGSKASGDKVKVKVEGNLNLESLQDKDTYEEKSSSSGFSISSNIKHPEAGKTGGNVFDTPNYSGSVSKGNIDSDYNSVTKQAEIHAGQGGFAIEVGKNTDLKGAVISSDATADKNKISTGTLTYSDIQNKAEYSASSVGKNYNKGPNTKLNEEGFTPNISTPAKGDATSTTKSAISAGTIEVRNNPKQDLSGLSRDSTNALNELGKIFDKKKIQEQQELAQVFGEVAYEEVHKIARAHGWEDGSPQKIALHAFVGGVMSDITGNGFKSGAVGAGVNEAVQKQLEKYFKDQPDMRQWASALIGAAAAKVAGGNAQAGASAAASGTKNNSLALDMKDFTGIYVAEYIVEGYIVIAGIQYYVGSRIFDQYYSWKINTEYPKSENHSTTEDGEGFAPTGEENSSRDRVDDQGNVITRRWYDGEGRAYKDVDFTNHGNPKRHPKVPHEHTWEWDEDGNPTRN